MKIIVQAHGTNVYHREEQKVHDYVKDFIPLGLSQLKKKTDLIESAVWLCEVVEWGSEWQFYLQDDVVVYKAPYKGATKPDIRIVDDMIQRLQYCSTGPNTYALDVDVLSSGKTALIEMNDAFAVSAETFPQTSILNGYSLAGIRKWRNPGVFRSTSSRCRCE
ncbi:hypothetical protein DDB_G0294348 [Dictyostelium discoideum AX4]|uniref:ATP-grasp domain-containing protein n=1 Tax=Dictyostelium discoideum TaxID=44689 RepID=Q54AM2_DICDI|nr:hypothetical protein DDB_G0294348 [Dictyostelium discoideum AX4]EAL60310.1 hypothetical protein DDB_G0294348 [Dictyostelium discoideum AX4]|eukprot:XP_628723.1 hypothetical protein DDB_G0294348 [Dictyostelium discoideum AX4]